MNIVETFEEDNSTQNNEAQELGQHFNAYLMASLDDKHVYQAIPSEDLADLKHQNQQNFSTKNNISDRGLTNSELLSTAPAGSSTENLNPTNSMNSANTSKYKS